MSNLQDMRQQPKSLNGTRVVLNRRGKLHGAFRGKAKEQTFIVIGDRGVRASIDTVRVRPADRFWQHHLSFGLLAGATTMRTTCFDVAPKPAKPKLKGFGAGA